MAGKVSVIRERDGAVKRLKNGRYIFTRDGVYFTLDEEQMRQMSALITGLLDGSLVRIDPQSEDMILAD